MFSSIVGRLGLVLAYVKIVLSDGWSSVQQYCRTAGLVLDIVQQYSRTAGLVLDYVQQDIVQNCLMVISSSRP